MLQREALQSVCIDVLQRAPWLQKELQHYYKTQIYFLWYNIQLKLHLCLNRK